MAVQVARIHIGYVHTREQHLVLIGRRHSKGPSRTVVSVKHGVTTAILLDIFDTAAEAPIGVERIVREDSAAPSRSCRVGTLVDARARDVPAAKGVIRNVRILG